jgi:hypothetical protein
VLYLDNQNQLIAHETLFTGTINRTEVHPREVVKRALHFNAAAVILAHNHPSGETTPSQADKTLTQRLVQVLQLVDIRVPDHLIVGGRQIYSFAEHGLLRYDMKIISKRRAMTIYRQHPESRSFATAPENISGTVASVITPAGTFRISPESSRYTPNAARTATGLMPA